MLRVVRFVNQLMDSNCYLVVDESRRCCVCIDPASEKSEREIEMIEQEGLELDYIMLTHEHTDHTWGVNALKERYPKARLVCSEACETYAPKASRAYFLLYYDDANYRYTLVPADDIVGEDAAVMEWAGHRVGFSLTPGHSHGSMCIEIEGRLFTGDTIMPFKPYFNGRDSNKEMWKRSVDLILSRYPHSITVCPGHGEKLSLAGWARQKEYRL